MTDCSPLTAGLNIVVSNRRGCSVSEFGFIPNSLWSGIGGHHSHWTTRATHVSTLTVLQDSLDKTLVLIIDVNRLILSFLFEYSFL